MDIIEYNNLAYKVALSNEINEEYIEDFINICCQAFGCKVIDKNLFNRKYINNIYGSSVLVVVYSNNKPVAARALWRNDIKGTRAFQPCDTSVMKEYQGKGIFSYMTKVAIDKLDKEDIIYNFPNQNSHRLYLKLGWQNHSTYRKTIMMSIKEYEEEHPDIIDNSYLQWWIKPQSQEFYVWSKGKNVFLVKKRKWNIYYIIGRINLSQMHNFTKLKSKAFLLLYYGSKPKLYNKNCIPLNITFRSLKDKNSIQIPVWKMDAI